MVIEMSVPAVLPARVRTRIGAHRAQNARTWALLERLGVEEGAELELGFAFESSGPTADRLLADHLGELGYEAELDADGVSGRTASMAVGPEALDEWVAEMLVLGAFSGWTATVRRP